MERKKLPFLNLLRLEKKNQVNTFHFGEMLHNIINKLVKIRNVPVKTFREAKPRVIHCKNCKS